MSTVSLTRAFVCVLLLIGLAACDTVAPDSVSGDASLALDDAASKGSVMAETRRATAKYQRVEKAIEDGYAPTPDCVAIPGVAGMGYHYANFGLIDDVVDPSAPEVLLYEPTKNGRLRLVAVEFMVHAESWDAGNAEAPEIAGMEFDDHRAVEDWHGLPFAHYDLHAWVWKNNPSGMFASFNPNVSCEYAPSID